MDQLLHIHVFGQTFTFKTDSSGEQAEAVAAALEGEVERIAADRPAPGSEMTKLTVLILAALNLANENYELKTDREHSVQRLTRRTTRLIQSIESGLAGLGGRHDSRPGVGRDDPGDPPPGLHPPCAMESR